MADTNTTKPYVPVWEKYALTIYEAAEYFGAVCQPQAGGTV